MAQMNLLDYIRRAREQGHNDQLRYPGIPGFMINPETVIAADLNNVTDKTPAGIKNRNKARLQ